MADTLSPFPMVNMEPVFQIRIGPSGNGLINRVEPTKKDKLFVDANISNPFFSFLAKPNADNARRVSFANAHVSGVFRMGYVAKIAYTVVCSNAINVVYFIRRVAKNVNPCKSMCGNLSFANFPFIVSIAVNGCERLSSGISSVKHTAQLLFRADFGGEHIWRSHAPVKQSIILVVIQERLRNILGNLFHMSLTPWKIPKHITYAEKDQ